MARGLGCFFAYVLMTASVIAAEPKLVVVRRQPIALAISADGERLFVANRASGTISVIDARYHKIVAESHVAERLEDLAMLPDGAHLLAIDSAANSLLLLRQNGGTITTVDVLQVPSDPSRLAVATVDGESRVAISSRWGNRLTIARIKPEPGNHTFKLAREHVVVLPFAPRAVLWLQPGRTVAVADAFSGRIAVIDAIQGKMLPLRSIPAHNIEALVFDQTQRHVIITQQFLNHRSETTADSIHWGFLLTNSVRALKTSDLLDPTADLGAGSHLAHLGEPGHGGGDPTGLAVLPNGDVLTSLAGVNEVAIGRPDAPDRFRIAVGIRPTAVTMSPNGRLAYVANTLDDSVSVVDWNARKSTPIHLGPTPPLRDVDLGERLFYDAKQSHEGWMSCQSCHGDGHTNGRLADTLGDGSFGAPKQVISLLGIADTAPYAWNGGIGDLETQVRKSIKTTLRQNETTDAHVRALTAYLKTLPPPPKRLATDLDAASVARGAAIFKARKCDRCHTSPTYTSGKAYDVGLVDESNLHEYNPPSLRGVSRRGPFFHDARARSLDEVFRRFGHPSDSVYTDQEANDLSTFLKSL